MKTLPYSPSKETPTPALNTNAGANANPPKGSSSQTLLAFLHDTSGPFGDPGQVGRSSWRERKQNMKADLAEWDKNWNDMKKQ